VNAAAGLLLRGRVITPAQDIAEGSVLVENGRVSWVRPGRIDVAATELIDGPGQVITPGFIDLQVNGFAGNDAAAGTDSISSIAAALPRTGITAFLPTMITAQLDCMANFVTAVEAAGREVGPGSARILGAHLEGPFLDPRKRGAHDADLMLEPTEANLDALLAGGLPAMVTLAPERLGAVAAIRRLHALGVTLSAGHSSASLQQARTALEAGIGFGTHLFNAMSGLDHHSPGLAAALLDNRDVVTGLIADGHHVDPVLLALTIRLKGPDRVALTTDQTAAAGMPPGRFQLGDRAVLSDGVTVRLEDGTLAGSVATMDGMVTLVARLDGVGLRAAVQMATSTPATVVGRGRRLGRIRAGGQADLTVMDRDGQVRMTVIGGRVVFVR
jgi:N-acetylglucosamine-6-phosphate deacetylase